MPEPDYGVSLSAPTKSIKPKEKTAAAKKASQPKAAAPKSFFEKFKASVTGPPTAGALAAQKEFMDNVGKSEGAADQRIKDAMNAGIGSLGGATADADM